MISRQDAAALLIDIKNSGVDIGNRLTTIFKDDDIIEYLKFINSNRPLDLTLFYEKLRKSYNKKHSKLYINIMKETEEITDVLTTLSSLLLQIFIFSKNVEDRAMFLRHTRANEILYVLNNYLSTYDLTKAIKLIKLYKADIKCMEYINSSQKL